MDSKNKSAVFDPRLFTQWRITPEQSAQLDFSSVKKSAYWNLIDRIICGQGKIRYLGKDYQVQLCGKAEHDKQESAEFGKSKSGQFLLSYRAIGDYRVCLIREMFL